MFTSLNNTLLLVHATEIAPIVTTDRDSVYLSVYMEFVRRAALVQCKSLHWRSYCPPSRRFDLLAVLSAAVDWVCFELDNDAFKMSLQQRYQSSSSTLLPWALLLISVLSATLSGNRTVPKSVGSVCTAKYNIFKCFCYGIHLLRALTWSIHQELESLCRKTIGSIFWSLFHNSSHMLPWLHCKGWGIKCMVLKKKKRSILKFSRS